MNIRTLKKQAKKKMNEIGNRNNISLPSLWLWLLATDHGRRSPGLLDSSGLLFFSNPWQDNPWSSKLRSVQSSTKVLVYGTNAEVLTLSKSREWLVKICTTHGISNPKFEFTSRIGYFWEHFYGSENFFGRGKHELPVRIIATGLMRDYSYLGGETLLVNKRLDQIAEHYKIPVTYIKSLAP